MSTWHNLHIVKNNFTNALKANAWRIHQTCEEMEIPPRTYYNWMKTDPEFAESVYNTRERVFDVVDCELMKKILAGDTQSIIFFCKSRMKNRGYGDAPPERHDIDDAKDVTEISDQDKKLLENYVQDRIKEMNDEKLIEGKAE